MSPARIARMPAAVAERIAAGEVIERPASVVKELVENALDAGASEVEVRVQKGGKLLIEVADDGEGIDPDDVVLAFARHATSKLRDENDLTRLSTFGFRGEALASMAAAARVTLTTRTDLHPHAVTVIASPEGLAAPQPAARRRGTTIRVEDLFAWMPARRKFLRGDSTELQKVRDIMRVFTVAHPERGFRFLSGDRMQWNLAPGTLADRLTAIWEDTDWVEVADETPQHRITGLLSHPHHHRGDAGDLHIFVNRRWVRDPMLRKAVLSAYERAIPSGRAPFGALFVDVDPATIDVNVHPAKTEIRFLNPGGLFVDIRQRVQLALEDGRRPPGRPLPPTGMAAEAAALIEAVRAPKSTGGAGHLPSSSTRPAAPTGAPSAQPPAPTAAPLPLGTADEVGEPDRPWSAPALVVMGALSKRYLLFREGDSLLIVDQHAAHERVRFDRIVAALDEGRAAMQTLMQPVVWRMEPIEADGWQHGAEWLARIGFDLSEFGPETLALRAVPAWLRGDPGPIVRETLRDLGDLGGRTALQHKAHELAARLACRGAVLSGRDMPLDEQRALMTQLLATPGGDTCPHGRPTWRRITTDELDRWFGR